MARARRAGYSSVALLARRIGVGKGSNFYDYLKRDDAPAMQPATFAALASALGVDEATLRNAGRDQVEAMELEAA